MVVADKVFLACLHQCWTFSTKYSPGWPDAYKLYGTLLTSYEHRYDNKRRNTDSLFIPRHYEVTILVSMKTRESFSASLCLARVTDFSGDRFGAYYVGAPKTAELYLFALRFVKETRTLRALPLLFNRVSCYYPTGRFTEAVSALYVVRAQHRAGSKI